jgi:hypothetical protein
MKIQFRLFMALCGCFVVSCAHTNNLKQYKVEQAPVEFSHRISGDAARGNSNLSSGSTGLAGVIDAVGNAAMSDGVAAKLDRVARPEMLATYISDHMKKMSGIYLKTIADSTNGASYLFETELTRYQLQCSGGGITVYAEANCRLLERNTGKIVWEDCEAESVSLRKNVAGALLSGTAIGAAVGLVNCSQLLDMSDDELRRALERAAGEVAYQIAETLREDVADMHDD